jgi:hypothetical protein
MSKSKEIPLTEVVFTQLLSCPKCGSRDIEFNRILENPGSISTPVVGIMHCKGACRESFAINFDSNLINFIKEMATKLLLKNNVSTQAIKSVVSKMI